MPATSSDPSDAATDQEKVHAFVVAALVRSGFLKHANSAESVGEWRAMQLVCRHWRDIITGVVFAGATLLVTHEQCARHRIPRRVERPERLRFVLDRLTERLPWLTISGSYAPATIAQLTRFHSEVHVDSLHKLAAKIERSMAALDILEMEDGFVSPRASSRSTSNGELHKAKKKNGFAADDDDSTLPCSPSSTYYRTRPEKPKSKPSYYAQFEFIDLDDDTILMRHTLDAALLAAGGVCHAIDQVLTLPESDSSQELQKTGVTKTPPRNAFCVVRPPGHHAEPHRAMGFCFFNNIGVGAFHALDKYAFERIAIIDFDVHHGNGTQKRVEKEPRLLYVSLHQSPWYPHSGFAKERGEYDNIVNIPLPARSGGAVYRQKFLDIVWPRVAKFQPQLILISAGFDGHAKDPLSDMRLQAQDFYWITNEIVALAWHCCQGRVVSVLEGGYNASALADSAEQHVKALLHGSVPHTHRPEHRSHTLATLAETSQ